MEARKGIDDEEKQAKLEMWGYALGFTPMAVVKCAIQLQIADVLEAHGAPMTHSDLSAAVACSPTILHRIMRYQKFTHEHISFTQRSYVLILLI